VLAAVQSVTADGSINTVVRWSKPITASDFDPGQWTDNNAGQIGVTITQLTATTFNIEWTGGVQPGDDWNYNDTVAYTQYPETGFMI
jgi:hypothetical protein